MASLVGFMLLDRQNVVADRDVQTPMGQMENAHSHEGQSVVRDGQVVFQGELAVEPAQIVYPIYLIVMQLPAVVLEAHFQLADQLFPKRRVTDGVQIIQIGPLGLAGAQMVQIDLVFHFFLRKEILIGILFLKIGTDKSNVRWEDPLILNAPTSLIFALLSHVFAIIFTAVRLAASNTNAPPGNASAMACISALTCSVKK